MKQGVYNIHASEIIQLCYMFWIKSLYWKMMLKIKTLYQ